MADIQTNIDALVQKVENQATVIDGVNALLQGLKEQLEQAQGNLDAAGEDAAAAQLGTLIEAIDVNTSRLAAALVANTEPPA